MKKILITDDDIYIGNMLTEALEKEGFGVLRAFSGTEALMLLEKETPDLILLDLMLPGISGEEVIRKISGIPVIVVSAKIDVDNKVELLSGGAADYVTKPFELKELIARIKLQLKNAEKSAPQSVIKCGDITVDTDNFCAFVSENRLKLTRTEFAILRILALSAPAIVTKSVLLDKISLETPDCVESSLKVHISNLRKKMREYSEKEYIESVWGIGFKLNG